MADTERRAPIGVYGEPRPRDMSVWTDAWLVEAVRGDPLDEAALEALARRHWRPLFGRCRMLAVNDEDASDLAQSAWVRVLCARRSLDPRGSFPAYLATIATNLWRDGHRSASRAGAMADRAMASLDAPLGDEHGAVVVMGDLLPDPHALPTEEHSLLSMELDEALARLTSRSQEMLVSRYLRDEPAAVIARRHGRTEQSISAWVRQALAEMKLHIGRR
jgi:RNA polymerase sigma factor (sigma-70 family)